MHGFVRQRLAGGAGVALMIVAGAAAGAQTQSANGESPAQPQRTIQLVPALASLDHTLDAKKAKQGDVVTAKLQKDVSIPEQPLPKNTLLEGHVDQVQASDHKSDSTVVVTFDKAKLKNGTEVPIKATVLEIAQPAYAQQASMGAPAAGGAPAGGGMPSAAPRQGGGAMGGGGGAAPGGATAPSAPEPQPMSAPDAASNAQQSQAQRNGVPGVTLQSDIHQHTSATFTSKGKNVHVPDGTQMEVAVAVVPAGTRVQ
jgi:hypothetical protein